MSNFFLIDHSLERSGGHHASYARSVAGAAQEMGFETTIGANWKLNQSSFEVEGTKVRRAFRQSTYQPFSYISGLRKMKRNPLPPELARSNRNGTVDKRRIMDVIKTLRVDSKRRAFVGRFAVDCARFFQPFIFTESDHAFFTTVSELELMGLAAWLATKPRTIQVHWHLQFHFNLFNGRPPEYDRQSQTMRAVRACFDAAMTRVPQHALHFYTTSQTLAEQYNVLKVGNFDVLPYPVGAEFTASPDVVRGLHRAEVISINGTRSLIEDDGKEADTGLKSDPDLNSPVQTGSGSESITSSSDMDMVLSFDEPVKLTVAGAVRREKGQVRALQPLVDKIWKSHLETGNVQLVVQRPVRRWPGRQKIDLNLPSTNKTSSGSGANKLEPVKYVRHPLPDDEYANLISDSDCGLLLYDDETYFSRRAGVMCEMLSCGKPVIVPAGTWLADQLQEPCAAHVINLIEGKYAARQLGMDELRWDGSNVPLPGGIVSFDNGRRAFDLEFDCEKGETGFAVKFDWHWPSSHGVYARIEVIQRDVNGLELSSDCQVVGQSRLTGDSVAFFRMHKRAQTVHVRLLNAFHDSNASVKRAGIHTIRSGDAALPFGAVGIVASDHDDVARCVDELIENFDHYAMTAEQFAGSWQRLHDPRRTVAGLISRERFQSRVA